MSSSFDLNQRLLSGDSICDNDADVQCQGIDIEDPITVNSYVQGADYQRWSDSSEVEDDKVGNSAHLSWFGRLSYRRKVAFWGTLFFTLGLVVTLAVLFSGDGVISGGHSSSSAGAETIHPRSLAEIFYLPSPNVTYSNGSVHQNFVFHHVNENNQVTHLEYHLKHQPHIFSLSRQPEIKWVTCDGHKSNSEIVVEFNHTDALDRSREAWVNGSVLFLDYRTNCSSSIRQVLGNDWKVAQDGLSMSIDTLADLALADVFENAHVIFFSNHTAINTTKHVQAETSSDTSSTPSTDLNADGNSSSQVVVRRRRSILGDLWDGAEDIACDVGDVVVDGAEDVADDAEETVDGVKHFVNSTVSALKHIISLNIDKESHCSHSLAARNDFENSCFSSEFAVGIQMTTNFELHIDNHTLQKFLGSVSLATYLLAEINLEGGVGGCKYSHTKPLFSEKELISVLLPIGVFDLTLQLFAGIDVTNTAGLIGQPSGASIMVFTSFAEAGVELNSEGSFEPFTNHNHTISKENNITGIEGGFVNVTLTPALRLEIEHIGGPQISIPVTFGASLTNINDDYSDGDDIELSLYAQVQILLSAFIDIELCGFSLYSHTLVTKNLFSKIFSLGQYPLY